MRAPICFWAAVLALTVSAPMRGEEAKGASAVEALPADVKAAYWGIRGDRIMPTIRFLASESLEGREAGERGAETAAEYLVSRFQAAGLAAGSSDGFLQRFKLRYRTLHPDEA